MLFFNKILKITFIQIILISSMFSQKVENIELNLIPQKNPFSLPIQIPEEFSDFSLILSGGGARAISHVGVIKFLLEENIPFTNIYGTSMGAIVGSMISAGYTIDNVDSILTKTNWHSFFSTQETFRNQLFLEEKRFLDNSILTLKLDNIQELIPNSINTGLLASDFFTEIDFNSPLNETRDFSNYLYNFKAVSTNLINGKSVILSKGNLGKALRASSSVTFLMPPLEYDTLLLVDGGISANIPVKQAVQNGSKFIIAVDATSPLRNENELLFPWEYADQLVSIPMQVINTQNLELADFVIHAKNDEHKAEDFTNLDSTIVLGYAERKNLKKLKSTITKYLINEDSTFAKKYQLNFQNLNEEVKSLLENRKSQSFNKAELYFILHQIFAKNDENIYSWKLVENGNYWDITLEKKENQKYCIKQFIQNKVNSEYVVSTDTIHYSPNQIKKIILKTLQSCRKKGNLLTHFENLVYENDVVSLYFKYEPIDSINIANLEITNPIVLEREIEFKNRDFNKKTLKSTLENIRTTNLFKAINYDFDYFENKKTLSIEAKEKATKLLRLGFRADNEYLTQIMISLRNENLLGTGNQMGFSFYGGLRYQKFAIEHLSPRIFDTYLTYKFKFYAKNLLINYYSNKQTESTFHFEREKIGDYWQREFGMNLSFGTQIEKSAVIYIEYNFATDLTIANSGIFPSEENNQIGSLRLTYNIDSRDKMPFTTEGVYMKTYFEMAFPSIGSEINYNKLSIDYQKIYPISEYSVIFQRFKLAYGDPTLPLTRQFSLGGTNSFFGLKDYDSRGRQIVLGSIGYRQKMPIKLFFDTYLSFRYDLGNLWENQENIAFQDLKHGVGFSLSLDTPIGPADFSIGKAFIINAPDSEKMFSSNSLNFYFTIGHFFDF